VGYEVSLSERFIDDLKEIVEYYTEKAGSEVAIPFAHQGTDLLSHTKGQTYCRTPRDRPIVISSVLLAACGSQNGASYYLTEMATDESPTGSVPETIV